MANAEWGLHSDGQPKPQEVCSPAAVAAKSVQTGRDVQSCLGGRFQKSSGRKGFVAAHGVVLTIRLKVPFSCILDRLPPVGKRCGNVQGSAFGMFKSESARMKHQTFDAHMGGKSPVLVLVSVL